MLTPAQRIRQLIRANLAPASPLRDALEIELDRLTAEWGIRSDVVLLGDHYGRSPVEEALPALLGMVHQRDAMDAAAVQRLPKVRRGAKRAEREPER